MCFLAGVSIEQNIHKCALGIGDKQLEFHFCHLILIALSLTKTWPGAMAQQ